MLDIEIVKSKLIGANLKRLLKLKKTNKWRIHRDCDISYQTLCNWQADRSRPCDKYAMRVGQYLGLIKPNEEELETLKREAQELNEKITRLSND